MNYSSLESKAIQNSVRITLKPFIELTGVKNWEPDNYISGRKYTYILAVKYAAR